MKYAVLYFSRTGNSHRVAEKIAKGLGVKPMDIKDNMNWSGIFGYIKGGYYASKNKLVDIHVEGDYQDAEQIIVISPVWAGGPAPAVRTFLKQVAPGKLHLVLTCKGSDVEDILSKYEAKVGKFKGRYGIVEIKKNEDSCIEEILKKLQNK